MNLEYGLPVPNFYEKIDRMAQLLGLVGAPVIFFTSSESCSQEIDRYTTLFPNAIIVVAGEYIRSSTARVVSCGCLIQLNVEDASKENVQVDAKFKINIAKKDLFLQLYRKFGGPLDEGDFHEVVDAARAIHQSAQVRKTGMWISPIRLAEFQTAINVI